MSIFYKDQRLTHMSKGDSYLWSKFLDKYPNLYYHYEYDVRVGQGVTLPGTSPEWLRKSARDLSRKRIDVVGHGIKTIAVIEVRVNAKANVLGDLIAYKFLYVNAASPQKPVIPILVTDSVDADLLIALRELNMIFYIA